MLGKRLDPGVLGGEIFGTSVLNLVVKSTAVAAILGRTIAGQPPDSSSVFLGIGLTLVFLVIYNSSCHYNSGLTVGAAVNGQISWDEVPRRCLGQLAGALLSDIFIWVYFGMFGYYKARLGASLPSDHSNIFQVILVEFGCSLVFYVVTLTIVITNTFNALTKAIGIGLTLGVMVLTAGPVSGGALNPAIGAAPLLLTLSFASLPVYFLVPFASGYVAGTVTKGHTKRQKRLAREEADRQRRLAQKATLQAS